MIDYHIHGEASTEELVDLYSSVGWSVYTNNEAVMAGLLEGATWWCTARENGKLVGLIRVISDRVAIAYVQDILVNPSHHRTGIGTQLLSKARSAFAHVRQFVLVTDTSKVTDAFYRSAGLVPIAEESGTCYVSYATGGSGEGS